jgi:ankyrin repeat protein
MEKLAMDDVVHALMNVTIPALHAAAGSGDEDEVRRLLREGADPNALERNIGASPLHIAAQGGSVAVGRALVEAGAFINIQAQSHGMTPLMVAIWHRRPEFVAFVLGQPKINVEIVNVLGLKARDLVGFGSASGDAAAPIDQRIRELLKAHEARRQAILDSQALYAAANAPLDEGTRAKRVRELISQGAAIDTISPRMNSGTDGHTPLHVAALKGQAEVVRELLAAGADQTIADAYMLSLPVHKAASFGQTEVMKLLVADPRFPQIANAQGPFNGYTPLHDAVWHGYLQTARVLVEAGVRTDIRGWDGRTPADLARDSGYGEIVALLERNRSR